MRQAMSELIKGALVASHIRHQVRKEVAALRARGVQPCLAVCMVGDNPASRIYVRRKQQACAAVGITSVRMDLPESASTEHVVSLIHRWNADPAVHGILVQLPLPQHIDRQAVLNAIDPAKDVDCVGATNLGLLMHEAPRFLPCTPAGIIELFRHYHISTRGRHVVVVSRSLTVGQPLAALLTRDHEHGNATVTLCHEHTRGIERLCQSADIVITAVGRPTEFRLRGYMVKRGAVVIDVGISRVDRRVIGDVDFDEVAEKASFITPVPGGVGPCTVAMLVKNTAAAARAQARARGGELIPLWRVSGEGA
jgi:methylenetetrahydrofolate dehydrogenase (NADP+)/methenyltetrahydrofolate cyclohydrolase